MDRILLGNTAVSGASSKSGFWVSKPGVNVVAYASNGYYAGTDPGPDGLVDGKVLPIYGFNQNFSFTGSNTYTYNWTAGVAGYANDPYPFLSTTESGTLLFNGNTSTGDPQIFYVMNTNPSWTGGGPNYNPAWRPHEKDTSFNGNTYPLLEFRVRRPLKSDGTHWQTSDFAAISTDIFQIFFATSNSSNDSRNLWVNTDVIPGPTRNAFLPTGSGWETVFGTAGEWVTIEYDFEHGRYKWERDDGTTNDGALRGVYHDWVSDTSVHAIRFDPFNRLGITKYPLHTRPDPDLEFDYIRAKKRGIPINFGNSIDDNFTFSSEWFDTGLVHQTGVVTIGTEYAYANGASKPSGTSHAGSQSGRVDFPKLPYIPVVLFQRYDDRNTDTKVSFPAGDKEFSSAHAEVTSDVKVWNPLSKQYQPSTNTSYASEFRTFAYARSGYDHFDLTSRNAIARDGYEWLFNYTPQEPYIEIYKGGNYDPESENPESFVLYPQVSQLVEQRSHGTYHRFAESYRQPGTGFKGNLKGYNIDPSFSSTTSYQIPAFNNARAVESAEGDITSGARFVMPEYPLSSAESETFPKTHWDYESVTGEGTANRYDFRDYVSAMPQPSDGLYIPAMGTSAEFLIHPGFKEGVIDMLHVLGGGDSGFLREGAPGLLPMHDQYIAGRLDTSFTNDFTWNGQNDVYQDMELHTQIAMGGIFSDSASGGQAFAVGKMNPGVLGVRRGRIIFANNIPTQGWDQKEGRGAPYPAEINATAFSAGGTIGAARFTNLADALDYSARDYTDGKLGYFANFTGTDQGNCLPTFDWANKFGDWNVPQFNNFYQYDSSIGAGSYVPFRDAIGTSWTEENTKFLDDSMWLGYANNRFEYKGDIWHPQAPTKTYDELSGVFGYGSSIKNQGDWAHSAGFGFRFGDGHGYSARDAFHFFAWPQEGATGIHAISRYDNSPYGGSHRLGLYGERTNDLDWETHYGTGPFHPHMQFRNRYGYAPGNIWDAHQVENIALLSGAETGLPISPTTHYDQIVSELKHYYPDVAGDKAASEYGMGAIASRWLGTYNQASKDFSSELGFCGPGGAFLWSAPHDYGRMGAVSPSHTPGFGQGSDYDSTYSSEITIQRITPPSIFWRRPADAGQMKLFSEYTPTRLVGQFRIPVPSQAGRYGRVTKTRTEASTHPYDFWFDNPYAQHLNSDFGVFYDNYTNPWDLVRMDSKNRSSSRLGFGGERPDTVGNDYESGKGHGRFPFHFNPGDTDVNGRPPGLSIDRDSTWTEPQTGYNGHKDSFVVSRWYTYPGATFSYDISNFSGPSHYNAWYKNDETEEVKDYKRRDYPQLYEGGWGNYGYFPTQEQLDVGKGATRLFPDIHGTRNQNEGNQLGRAYYTTFPIVGFGDVNGQIRYWGNIGAYGSHPLDGVNDPATNLSITSGPNMIFKKTGIIAVNFAYHNNNYSADMPDERFETAIGSLSGAQAGFPVRAYFAPNHKHLDKQVSRTFGIPNDIAGDYFAASKRHNERGENPDVITSSPGGGEHAHVDAFLAEYGKVYTGLSGSGYLDPSYYSQFPDVVNAITARNGYASLIHTKEYSAYPSNKNYTYYHPQFDGEPKTDLEGNLVDEKAEAPVRILTDAEYEQQKDTLPYPDEKLRKYLLRNGIDLNTLLPGQAIPIKEDPYFAGMAFEGTNGITGAFNAHRFEFIIKKTKSHINHFRQSYEYNLPGRFPHRADTLRPIGYGLVSNHYGFDDLTTPPPAAHSYFDGRQLGGGHPYLQNRHDQYVYDWLGVSDRNWPIFFDSGIITDAMHDPVPAGATIIAVFMQ